MAETVSVQAMPLRGLDQRWKPSGGTAATAQDLTQDERGGWKEAGGYRRCVLGPPAQPSGYTNPFLGTGTIVSLFSFIQGAAARHFLVYEATFSTSPPTATLVTLNPSTRTSLCYDIMRDRNYNALDGRTVPITPWAGSSYAVWNDRLYIVNGYDAPVVFDGWRADQAGWDSGPPAPQAQEILGTTATVYAKNLLTDATGANEGQVIPGVGLGPIPSQTLDETGSIAIVPYIVGYRYVVAYKNDRGQVSPWSPASATVRFSNGSTSSIANGAQFVLVDVPIGPDSTVSRLLGRTVNFIDAQGQPIGGYGDTFYELVEIPDNASRVYEDFQPDDALGPEIDLFGETGPWPRNASLNCVFKNRQYLAGMNDVDVVFSYVNKPEQFPVNNRLVLRDTGGGRPTGLWPVRNAVLVTKARSVHLIKEDDSLGPSVSPLSSEAGCIASRSFVDIPGHGVAFIGDHAIWMLQGALLNEPVETKLVRISTPIPGIINSLNWSAMAGACATLNANDREVWFCVPWIGYQNNSHILVWHYETNDWTIRPNFPIQCVTTTQDRRGYVYFGSWATTAGISPDGEAHLGIFVYSLGFDDKDGTAITPVYESSAHDFGYLWKNVEIAELMVYCVGYGKNLTLDYRVNRDAEYIRALENQDPLERDQQYADRNHQFDVYGDTLDTGVGVWGTSVWGSWRPVVLVFPVALTVRSPAQELSVRLEPADGVGHIQIIGFDYELRVGDPRKRKPVSDVVG